MSLTAQELTDLAVTQRKDRQYEEALASALAATKANPGSANAWWQVALSRLALGDPRNAIPRLGTDRRVGPALRPWLG